MKQQGFTIIETLVVLAIAGMILAVALMAFPALQRNAHNNERKQDVASMLQAVSRWGLNNSGGFPQATDRDAIVDRAKRSYYTDNNSITISPRTSEDSIHDIAAVANIDEVLIVNYASCSADGGGKGVGRGAGYNDVVALYRVETRTGSAPQCQQL